MSSIAEPTTLTGGQMQGHSHPSGSSPDSAEHLSSLIRGLGLCCPHFPKYRVGASNSAINHRYPSRLGFFHAQSSEVQISYLDTSKLCNGCLESVIPRGFNFWSTFAWASKHDDSQKEQNASLVKRGWLKATSSDRSYPQLLQAGTEGFPLLPSSSRSRSTARRTVTLPKAIFIPQIPFAREAWEWLQKDRKPFYIDQLHLTRGWNVLAEGAAEIDARIAQNFGISFVPPQPSETMDHQLVDLGTNETPNTNSLICGLAESPFEAEISRPAGKIVSFNVEATKMDNEVVEPKKRRNSTPIASSPLTPLSRDLARPSFPLNKTPPNGRDGPFATQVPRNTEPSKPESTSQPTEIPSGPIPLPRKDTTAPTEASVLNRRSPAATLPNLEKHTLKLSTASHKESSAAASVSNRPLPFTRTPENKLFSTSLHEKKPSTTCVSSDLNHITTKAKTSVISQSQQKPSPTSEPKAKPNPTPQPKAKPTPTPQPRAKPTPTPQPRAKPTPTPQPRAKPTPTPQPKAKPSTAFTADPSLPFDHLNSEESKGGLLVTSQFQKKPSVNSTPDQSLPSGLSRLHKPDGKPAAASKQKETPPSAASPSRKPSIVSQSSSYTRNWFRHDPIPFDNPIETPSLKDYKRRSATSVLAKVSEYPLPLRKLFDEHAPKSRKAPGAEKGPGEKNLLSITGPGPRSEKTRGKGKDSSIPNNTATFVKSVLEKAPPKGRATGKPLINGLSINRQSTKPRGTARTRTNQKRNKPRPKSPRRSEKPKKQDKKQVGTKFNRRSDMAPTPQFGGHGDLHASQARKELGNNPERGFSNHQDFYHSSSDDKPHSSLRATDHETFLGTSSELDLSTDFSSDDTDDYEEGFNAGNLSPHPSTEEHNITVDPTAQLYLDHSLSASTGTDTDSPVESALKLDSNTSPPPETISQIEQPRAERDPDDPMGPEVKPDHDPSLSESAEAEVNIPTDSTTIPDHLPQVTATDTVDATSALGGPFSPVWSTEVDNINGLVSAPAHASTISEDRQHNPQPESHTTTEAGHLSTGPQALPSHYLALTGIASETQKPDSPSPRHLDASLGERDLPPPEPSATEQPEVAPKEPTLARANELIAPLPTQSVLSSSNGQVAPTSKKRAASPAPSLNPPNQDLSHHFKDATPGSIHEPPSKSVVKSAQPLAMPVSSSNEPRNEPSATNSTKPSAAILGGMTIPADKRGLEMESGKRNSGHLEGGIAVGAALAGVTAMGMVINNDEHPTPSEPHHWPGNISSPGEPTEELEHKLSRLFGFPTSGELDIELNQVHASEHPGDPFGQTADSEQNLIEFSDHEHDREIDNSNDQLGDEDHFTRKYYSKFSDFRHDTSDDSMSSARHDSKAKFNSNHSEREGSSNNSQNQDDDRSTNHYYHTQEPEDGLESDDPMRSHRAEIFDAGSSLNFGTGISHHDDSMLIFMGDDMNYGRMGFSHDGDAHNLFEDVSSRHGKKFGDEEYERGLLGGYMNAGGYPRDEEDGEGHLEGYRGGHGEGSCGEEENEENRRGYYIPEGHDEGEDEDGNNDEDEGRDDGNDDNDDDDYDDDDDDDDDSDDDSDDEDSDSD